MYINMYVQLHALQIVSELDSCAFFGAATRQWTLFILLYINNYIYTKFNNKSDLVFRRNYKQQRIFISYHQIFLLRVHFYKPKEIILKRVFYRISVRQWQ